MKISKTAWAIIIVLVIAGGAFWFVSANNAEDTSTSEQTQTQQSESVNQEIIFSEDGKVVTYKGVVGEVALTTLKRLTEVRVENSTYGEFVTGIGEVDADSSVNFWGFYVDGEMATVGAGDYVSEGGDEIEWRITELE